MLCPPTVTTATSITVSGTAPPNSTVEIFSDLEDEGSINEGTVTADGSGNFTWSGNAAGPHVTATDGDGNTSQFSSPAVTGVEKNPAVSVPKAFSLSQNYPNPFNGSPKIEYNVDMNCDATLEIFDARLR